MTRQGWRVPAKSDHPVTRLSWRAPPYLECTLDVSVQLSRQTGVSTSPNGIQFHPIPRQGLRVDRTVEDGMLGGES
jgi:hypothetical protein